MPTRNAAPTKRGVMAPMLTCSFAGLKTARALHSLYGGYDAIKLHSLI